ncbi:MAG TPA: GTP 3',8-cyclase MoaA [Gammaproteobacteria bacterium]|nr:GTP 3',8-cyclase MoaA [Gammaproteobacteria bacterium]
MTTNTIKPGRAVEPGEGRAAPPGESQANRSGESPAVKQWHGQFAVKDRLNRPLRDLRISVIDRCNYRCPYCMPAEVYGEGHQFLPRSAWLTPGEIKRLGSLFLQLGVTKFRLTGGEPLLRRDLPEIVAGLAELPGVDDVALTTNGTLLAQQAKALRAAGLQRVTVSLDSVDEAVFRQMSGHRGELTNVLTGIEAALEAGFAPLKLNVTVQRGKNEAGVLDIVERFRGTGIIVRFIEYMDVGTLNGWRPEDVVTSLELIERISARWPVEALESNYRGEVATRYRFLDGQGEIGFISSVSEPFCGDCHRARLSADGTLYTCLFAANGTNLRDVLRAGASDAELIGLLQNLWRGRADRYSELRGRLRASSEPRRVEMYRMGG